MKIAVILVVAASMHLANAQIPGLGGGDGFLGTDDSWKCPGACTRRIDDHMYDIYELKGEVEGILAQIGQAYARCPASAPTAERIGSHCYTLHAGPSSFADASLACKTMGGYLAEPPPTKTYVMNFLSQLRAVFPTDATAVDSLTTAQQACHIGIKRVATGLPYYSYMKCSQQLPIDNAIFDSTSPDDSANTALTTIGVQPDGDFIVHTAGPASATVQATDMACYICEYQLEEAYFTTTTTTTTGKK